MGACWTAFDAIDFGENARTQYKPDFVQRELNKAFAAFALPAPFVKTKKLATGAWGCGVFKGDKFFKALIQWTAASEAGLELHYFPFDDPVTTRRFEALMPLAQRKGMKTCDLAKWLLSGNIMPQN